MRHEPRCKLTGIADPTPEAAAYAASIGVPCFTTYAEMLDRARPEAAIIATPNVLHVPAGLACAERGVHMLVEKPLADTVEAATQLSEAAERAGVALLVGHHRRYNPVIEKARAIVQSGGIGRVTAISAQWMLLKPSDYFDIAHRREPGAGPLLTNAVHDIDDLRFICGEIDSLQAMASNAVRGFPVEDTAVVLLQFANGALGTLTVSDTAASPWSWELTSGENPFYPRIDENCYLIAGTEGALTVPKLQHWRYGAAKGWRAPLSCEPIKITPADPLVRQIQHFCRVIRGEEPPRITGADATRTLACVQAIQDAARTGRAVKLN
ncbi:MAG: Gfo/Idh/MocA family oxidoreductase [Betaproteobacteria bacterium]